MKRFGVLIFLASFLGSSALRAGEGQTPHLTLLRAVGARAAGLGQGFSAVANDVQSIGFNPGALGSIQFPSVSATYNTGVFEDKTGNVACAYPVSMGTIFIGGSYYDAGHIEVNLSNGVQGTRDAQKDMVGILGLAFGKGTPLSLGVSGKFYKSELAEMATASGFGGDVGLFFRTPLSGLTLGTALQNIGSDLAYEVEKEKLPQTFRGGAAYEFDLQRLSKFTEIPYQLMFTADGSKTRDQDESINSGVEFRRELFMGDKSGSAAIRAGYESGPERVAMGFGFQLGLFLLDYSFGLSEDELNDIHRVTIGWSFIPISEQQRGRALKF